MYLKRIIKCGQSHNLETTQMLLVEQDKQIGLFSFSVMLLNDFKKLNICRAWEMKTKLLYGVKEDKK